MRAPLVLEVLFNQIVEFFELSVVCSSSKENAQGKNNSVNNMVAFSIWSLESSGLVSV